MNELFLVVLFPRAHIDGQQIVIIQNFLDLIRDDWFFNIQGEARVRRCYYFFFPAGNLFENIFRLLIAHRDAVCQSSQKANESPGFLIFERSDAHSKYVKRATVHFSQQRQDSESA